MERPFQKPAVRTRIYVGTDMIGEGKIAFLQIVARTGSLNAAAAEMGVTPTRAWFFLDTLQNCFREPLFTVVDRETDAEIALTPLGHDLLARFEAHDRAIQSAARPFLDWLNPLQPDPAR